MLTHNKHLGTPITTTTTTTTFLLEAYSDNTLRLKIRKQPQNYKNNYNNYF
jgi:hypothetical protein